MNFVEILNDSGFAVLLLLCFFFSFQQVQTLLQQMVREKLLSTYLSLNIFYLVPVNSTSFNFFFVSRLQQDKFQQMSDQIITRNILYIIWSPNLKWILLFNDYPSLQIQRSFSGWYIVLTRHNLT